MVDQSKLTGVVIVAAGRGERAGSDDGPKQYRKLGGKPVLSRTLDPFLNHKDIHHVVVVIHEDDRDLYAKACPQNAKLIAPALGGTTRQLSVLAGLETLSQYGVDNVLIHDAARPFIDHALISRVVDALADHPAALPCVAIADTVKKGAENGHVLQTISRDGLFAAQTPQGFKFSPIFKAHREAAANQETNFTDDSALAEWADIPVQLVEGSPQNTKITSAEDIRIAQDKFALTVPDIRVGHGYDTHQLVPGKSIWLCGVEIEHTHALSGHSDADVGLHALTDALLSAVADGDIGSHFPPSDPKWKGARSNQFLKHAVDRVLFHGGTITHMDVTLICEAPKIAPHRDTMRGAIAEICQVDVSRISVKATTNETIGFVGRNEGMVALATATVVMGGT